MSDQYTIERLQPENFNELIPLMKACFGMDVNIAYFEWKFLKNPAGDFVGFVARDDANNVAAYYGVIPEKYNILDNEIIVYQSCDTMTHPNHRRKGLFQKLATHCYDYLRERNQLFVFGFSGQQSTPGFLKFGWSHLFDLKYYFFPKQFNLFTTYKVDSEISETKDYKKLKGFIEHTDKNLKIYSLKSIEFIGWRLQNPLHHYYVKTKGKSYIIYYIENNKIFLFDFYFSNKPEGKALIISLKQKLRELNLAGIITIQKGDSIKLTQLKRYFFISNPFSFGPLAYRIPFILFNERIDNPEINEPVNWKIEAFDHDSL